MKSLQIALLLLVVFLHCNLVASADLHKYKGDNYTFKCTTTTETDVLGVYLKSRRSISREVVYYFFENNKTTIHNDYEGRVQVQKEEKTLTIDIFNLQLEDTGAYWCICNKYSGKFQIEDSGVFLLVQEPETSSAASKRPSQSSSMSDLLIPVTALTAGSVLLLILLLLGVWLCPKMKKLIKSEKAEEKRPGNGVYEVMTIPRRKEYTHASV